MNNVSLTGRITKIPELRYTQSQKAYLMFTIAVDRTFKDVNGEKITDFINCVAWNSQAEFIASYVNKGNLIEVTGQIQNRTYQTQSGENRILTEIIIDSVSNLTPKPKEEAPEPQEPYYKPKETNTVDDEDLPF